MQARPGVSEAEIRQMAAQSGSRVLRRLRPEGLYLLKTNQGEDSQAARRAFSARRDAVRFAEPNLIRYAHYTPKAYPNDPYYQNNTSPSSDFNPGNSFPIALTELDRAWNTTTGGMNVWSKGVSTVVISDLDTGMNVNHQDFVGRVLPGFQSVHGSADFGTSVVTDTDGHGTNVASFISVNTNNGVGIAGGCVNCMLRPVKCSSSGNFNLSDEVDALTWAADHGVQILNLSFGGAGAPNAERNAINYALSKGCLIFASSGNEGDTGAIPPDPGPIEYPANYPGVYAIGASDHNERLESFSNWGAYQFCVAPDGGVAAHRSNNSGYDLQNEGTSFTAPAVSALAGILRSNGDSNAAAISRIARTCDKIDAGNYPYDVAKPLGSWNERYGYGRINHYRAMSTLVPPTLDSVSNNLSDIGLTWSNPPLDDPSQPLSYTRLYRANSSGGPYSVVGSFALTTTSYADTLAPTPGITRYYVLKGVNSNDLETKASNEAVGMVFATPTPTSTISPTPTPTPTSTQTPVYASSGSDKVLLGPVPVKRGQDLCLYFDQAPRRTQGTLYNSLGERVGSLEAGSEYRQCWATKSLAAGIYFCQSDVEYQDGSRKSRWQKIVILP